MSIRKFVLPPAVVVVLEAYRKTVDSRWMFPSPVKEDAPITPGVVRRRLELILEHAGCRHVRFHDLRHTFVTMAISSGVDVKHCPAAGAFQCRLHPGPYTHVTNDMQRGAAEKIGGFMESATTADTPEPPDLPEESQCKVIPFEKVG